MSGVGSYAVSSFWLPASLMGVGIGIDVCVATLARFRSKNMTWRNWTLPITATHIVFPAFGYYLWWALGEFSLYLLLPLGLVAFLLVSLFLYEQICDWAGFTPTLSLSRMLGISEEPTAGASGWIAILAVSVDAGASGPAKAAVATSYDWTTEQVFLSFILAGFVVAVMSQAALSAARSLRRLRFRSDENLALWLVGASFVEASVIGGFGLLSGFVAFSGWIDPPGLWTCLLLSVGGFAAVFSKLFKRLIRHSLSEIARVET